MPKVKFLPSNVEIEAHTGTSLLDIALEHEIPIQHACGGYCACTTCHVIVREGFASLEPSDEDEDDMLDKAWGLTPLSRLSCRAKVQQSDLTIEIPKYSINQVKEGS